MSPARFIPIAEKTGQIVELGQWTLAKACEDAKSWPDITIAVNVSTVQLQRRDFAPSIEALLEATGFDPARLELEITETAWSKNEEGLMRTLARLQNLGVGFSLDDFGSGYSSLTYLRRFPVTRSRSIGPSLPMLTSRGFTTMFSDHQYRPRARQENRGRRVETEAELNLGCCRAHALQVTFSRDRVSSAAI